MLYSLYNIYSLRVDSRNFPRARPYMYGHWQCRPPMPWISRVVWSCPPRWVLQGSILTSLILLCSSTMSPFYIAIAYSNMEYYIYVSFGLLYTMRMTKKMYRIRISLPLYTYKGQLQYCTKVQQCMGNSFPYFNFNLWYISRGQQCKSLSGGAHPAVSPIVQLHATKVDITREGQLHHILGLDASPLGLLGCHSGGIICLLLRW